MNNFIFAVLAFIKETDDEKIALLKREENAGKIAEAQGIIAGDGLLRGLICKRFGISRDTAKEYEGKYPSWPSLQTPSLYQFHDELGDVMRSEEYTALVKDIEAENDYKKNWLWMSAEKGRDLTYVKGWKEGMQSLDTVTEALQKAYTQRRQELQFDADKKADEAFRSQNVLPFRDRDVQDPAQAAAAEAAEEGPPDEEGDEGFPEMTAEAGDDWQDNDVHDPDATVPEVDGDAAEPVF
jgi:hypothetical protein